MYTLLRGKTEGLRDQVTHFAQELIRIPSRSLDENELAARVEQELRALGYDEVLRDDAGNVVGILSGRELEPTVLLNCHMDTVGPADEEPRTGTDSVYSGHLDDGYLYGLGAADCKGGLAAQVYAGALLKRSQLPLRGNVIVAATVAEENGCSIGMRALLERTLPSLNLKPSFAILGEPTGLGLYYGHDGWIEVNIKVEGTNPFCVDDATQSVFNDYSNRAEGQSDTVALHRPYFENGHGFRRATIRMDRKIGPTDKVEAVLSQIKHDAQQSCSASAVAVGVAVREEHQTLYNGRTTSVRRVTHSWSTDPFSPLIERTRQALAAADCVVQPGKWTLGRMGMGTAGSVLTHDFQIPTIGYGPGLETMAHAPNERVEVQKIVEAVYGTAAIVHGLAGVPIFGWTSDDI